MSTISTFYDQLNALLLAQFGATHKKLVNPYKIEENDDKLLNRGYGFNVVSGENPRLVLDCHLSMARSLEITLTIINRGTDRDILIRETSEKTLLEDHAKLLKAVLTDPNLNETLAKLEYQSDNGIEYVQGEKENFIMIKSTYLIQYIENL